jgi:hypothetical protein
MALEDPIADGPDESGDSVDRITFCYIRHQAARQHDQHTGYERSTSIHVCQYIEHARYIIDVNGSQNEHDGHTEATGQEG